MERKIENNREMHLFDEMVRKTADVGYMDNISFEEIGLDITSLPEEVRVQAIIDWRGNLNDQAIGEHSKEWRIAELSMISWLNFQLETLEVKDKLNE